MKFSKWKNFLIGGNIPKNIDAPRGYIKALKIFMQIAITKKNALL
jgi:hypothetical protein